MDIKQRFPSEEVLSSYIAEYAAEYTQSIKDSVGHLEADYIEKSTFRFMSMVMIAVGLVMLFVTIAIGSAGFWVTSILLVTGLCLIIAGFYKMSGTKQAIDSFNSAFNGAMYPIVFQVFSLSAVLVSRTGKLEIFKKDLNPSWWKKISTALNPPVVPGYGNIISFLNSSELITEPRNKVSVDDIFKIDIAGRSMFVSELDVKHVTGSGKNRHTKNIFTGYFVSFELPRLLEGKTFVAAEDDSEGFGYQSFINSLLNRGVEETKLEWNDFEDLLRVVSDNPVEARYILTPDFMNDLYDWWLSKKKNIRLSFVGDRMCMLFPDKRLPFDSTIAYISPDEIKDYLESVCLPLLHVLHLVEDVESRF